MGREFQAGASQLQGPRGFPGTVALSQELERATSMLDLWCWWPRLGLPSRAKKGQHCSAWVLLPQPQRTGCSVPAKLLPQRAGVGSHRESPGATSTRVSLDPQDLACLPNRPRKMMPETPTQ